MARTLTLNVSASVTLNGSGNGTVQLGPKSAGEVWFPSVVSVGTNETVITDEANCSVYVGPYAGQGYFVDLTIFGSTGASSSNIKGQVVYPGNFIWAVWTGGDNGAQATLNVSGTKQVP